MSASNQMKNDQFPDSECIESKGPWPFVTRRVYQASDQSKRIWSSRHHRKGLHSEAEHGRETTKARATGSIWRCLWMPRKLNWWIGTVFALGSLLFALASVLSLAPALAQAWSLDSTGINAIFFAGSIPFTIAAYLQLFQAANADELVANDRQLSRRLVLFGWRPRDIGWLSSALQLVGTILFNINTLDAMLPSLDWLQQDLAIWAPDFVGSILFLASGYLAFLEVCHAYWAWKPSSISWWVGFTNLLGCIGFMISAVFAIVLPGPPDTETITLSIVFTLLGAIGFLVGSLLMLPETISQEDAG